MEDAELIERIKQGEEQYLNVLIEKHYESIRKYCYWKTGHTETAQDITQETFYRFFRHFGQYSHAGKCRAYLYTIARNLCADYYLAKRKYSTEELAESDGGEMPSMEEAVGSQLDVDQLLADLPQEQQELLLLRFSYDLKYREIAEITGINLCLVQYRVKRGLSTLRKKLERSVNDEEVINRTDSKQTAATRYAPN